MNPADLIGYVLLGLLILVGLVAVSQAQGKLDDPNESSVVYLDQLTTVAKLSGQGHWLVRICRQSGNVHSESELVGSASTALNAAISTFRRAKIEAVGVSENGPSKLRMARLYHNHRGSNEGKKVGSAEIIRLA